VCRRWTCGPTLEHDGFDSTLAQEARGGQADHPPARDHDPHDASTFIGLEEQNRY
jgi:hypothetical protein